jgi:hypothetical protein
MQERGDLAMVQMHKQMERKRAEKYQNNLHMIDLPKQNQHIKFVSSLAELKSAPTTEVEMQKPA